MKKINALCVIIILLVISFCVNSDELKINDDDLFKGVIKQSNDNSCGAAALSTLITGTIESSHVSESDIIDSIKETSKHKVIEEGYSLHDLQATSEKFGYPAQWRKVAVKILPQITQPVILLIGLNSEFPHFVVLKGIKNDEAFLADSIRGNIRIPYDKLIQEGINGRYSAWFVMAINPSTNKPKDSALYLSSIEAERHQSHVTADQSNLITLTTIAKKGQFIADYGFNASLGRNINSRLHTYIKDYTNSLAVYYGVTENTQIGVSFEYDNNREKTHISNYYPVIYGESNNFSLHFNNRFPLDDQNKGFILGSSASIIANRNTFNSAVEKDTVYEGGFNALFYTNTNFARFIVGGSVNKQFSQNEVVSSSLPEYQVSGFISANKPFADRYLGSVTLSVNDGHNKNNLNSLDNVFQRSYKVDPIVQTNNALV